MGCEAAKPRFNYQEQGTVKFGKPIRGLPAILMSTALRAVEDAEKKFCRPVYVAEISASWRNVAPTDPPPCNVLFFACLDLYLNDELLASPNCEQFSMDPYQ